MAKFERPNIPYRNKKLNNSNRYKDLKGAAPTGEMLDSDFNFQTDSLNVCWEAIGDVVAGALPGSDDINNANTVATTDGQGNVPFTKITSAYVQDGGLLGKSLAASTITNRELSEGCVSADNISEKTITQSELALLSVGTGELQNECNTLVKQAPNSINDSKVIRKSLTATALKEKTLTNLEMANGTVNTDILTNGAATLAKLAQDVKDFINALVPVGSSMEWGGNTEPTSIPGLVEWKEENGQAISRTTYSVLFAKYGTTHGAGNGSTTFNLPDRRGVTGVGIGSDNSTGGRVTSATAPNIALGKKFGAETHTLTQAQMPSHTHDVLLSDAGGGAAVFPYKVNGNSNTFLDYPTNATGGDQPHNNMPPSMFMRYYIRAL